MLSLNSYCSLSTLPLSCQFWGKVIQFNGNCLHFQGGLSLKPVSNCISWEVHLLNKDPQSFASNKIVSQGFCWCAVFPFFLPWLFSSLVAWHKVLHFPQMLEATLVSLGTRGCHWGNKWDSRPVKGSKLWFLRIAIVPWLVGKGVKDFIQAPIFPSPFGCQPQDLPRVMLATTGGPTGTACQHPALVEAVWWPHIQEGMAGLCLFSAWLSPGWAPQGQLCILLPTGEDREETCGLAVLPPSAHPCQHAAHQCSLVQCSCLLLPLVSFLFPFCAPSHTALY